MDSDVDIERLREDLGIAIARVFQQHEEASLLINWVLVAETYADDDRGTWCVTPNDMKVRDSLGLLTQALELERAGIVAERVVEMLER